MAGLPLCVTSDDLVDLFSVFGDVAALALHPSEARCANSFLSFGS